MATDNNSQKPQEPPKPKEPEKDRTIPFVPIKDRTRLNEGVEKDENRPHKKD